MYYFFHVSEQVVGTRTEDIVAQDSIFDYVSAVLAGEKAKRMGGFSKISELSGTPDERRIYGGLFVAAILHFHANSDMSHAPVDDNTTDKDLWREGLSVFHDIDGYRDDGGRISIEMQAKIYEYSPLHDERVDIGRTLLSGLRRRQLQAEKIAADAVLAMQYRFGRGHRLTGLAEA